MRPTAVAHKFYESGTEKSNGNKKNIGYNHTQIQYNGRPNALPDAGVKQHQKNWSHHETQGNTQ
jgi:hypothetical protein